MKRKLLIILNEPIYFVSHRLPIAIAAQKAGYEIHIATGVKTAPQRIHKEGFIYHAIPLSRSGRNIFSELFSLLTIYRLMTHIKPDIAHLVTIKPVIYGSLAARAARVPAVVAAIAGLGYAFVEQHPEAKRLRKLISWLYRQAFRHKNLTVIFQNNDDKNTLLNVHAVKEKQSVLICGSGVDLTHYQYCPEPNITPLIVVMAARLLRDKGVNEYVEAAKHLRVKGVAARFLLAGQVDPGNPSSIDPMQLTKWIKEGYIEYIGYCENTAALFSQAHLVILPSYREGLPRVLAEAAACGRAVITTDVPGCRAAIIPGKTGLLVQAKNAHELTEAIHTLLLNSSLRKCMGEEGRKLAETKFNITQIVDEHLRIYHAITHHGRGKPHKKTHHDSLKNIRIARVSTIPFPMLTQLQPQLKAIAQAGGQITLVTSQDTQSDALDQIDYCMFCPITITREINFFADIRTLWQLWKLFRYQEFDIVHSITPKAGLLCAIAARLAGVPIRLHTYTGQPWVTMQGVKQYIIKVCDKLISKLNTQCHTDSVSQRQFLIDNKIVNPKKIKVLGNGSLAGIDVTRFDRTKFSTIEKTNIKKTLNWPKDALIFLFIGRVTEDKGIYELLKCTNLLLTEGYNIALLIVGPFEQRLEQEITPLAQELCGNRAICIGFNPKPERYMAIADVLCIPSYREGFGTVVIEAGAMNLPAIGTKIYGLTDAIIDGETGILVEPKNISQLKKAMKNLADNAPLRIKLGENARKRALSKFDSKKLGQILVMEYIDLLNKTPLPPNSLIENILEQGKES